MNQIKVLLLDDELPILNSLRRLLTREGFNVNCFQNPHEALSFLRANNDIQVIVSDMRMPDLNGADFFEEVMKIDSMPTRIALSGYAEKDNILRAINQGKVWAFVAKPWSNTELIKTLLNASSIYKEKSEKEVLLRELEHKSGLLDNLSDHLEEMVSDSNYELMLRIKILEDLLAGEEHATVSEELNACMNILSKHSGHHIVPLLETEEMPKGCFPIQDQNQTIGFVSCDEEIVEGSEHYDLMKRLSSLAIYLLKRKMKSSQAHINIVSEEDDLSIESIAL